jgi:hypothetical protein
VDFLFFSRERNAHGSNYHVSIFRRREIGRRGFEYRVNSSDGPRPPLFSRQLADGLKGVPFKPNLVRYWTAMSIALLVEV